MARSSRHEDAIRTTFAGRVAIVTGAGSGIGRALALALARRGSRVVAADIDPDGASETVDLARRASDGHASDGRSGEVAAATVDVADSAAVADLVKRTADEHGQLHLLFNNAGVGIGGEVRDLSLAHWERAIDVNLRGVVNGVAAAYPLMCEQRHGTIVNTASLAGLVPSPMLTPYATTKHAVVGLSTSLRLEAKAFGVRVCVICPGVIDTPLLDKGQPADLPDAGVLPDVRAMLTAMVGPPYPVQSLAEDVLAGVARDRAVIVTPRHARIVWGAYRISPALLMSQGPARIRKVLRRQGRTP